MTKPITSFSGEYRFLSNFWPCQVEFEGLIYPASEHAYVAAKTVFQIIRKHIAESGMTAGQVKRFGRDLTIRPDWEEVKLNYMRIILESKFANVQLFDMLKATAPCELIEGNTWGDTYWGVCNGKGQNNLGKLLMTIRDDPFEKYK